MVTAVIVSGYFDPLHVGHLEYFHFAKELGDVLIVIVNNDAQAKLKKGYSFMSCEERLHIVRSLEVVDNVFLSIDINRTVCDTLRHLHDTLSYDEWVFANGGDRHASEVPEAKVCEELGIEMVDGLGDKIRSSSDLVESGSAKKLLSNVKNVVFDVDGVLVPRGTNIKVGDNRLELEFKVVSDSIIEKIRSLRAKGYSVYISSGRSLFLLMEMFRPVMDCVTFIYENGCAKWDSGEVTQLVDAHKLPHRLYAPVLDIVKREVGFRGFEPKEYILTIHSFNRIKALESFMAQQDEFYCLWNGEAYDIGPKGVTKANGMPYFGSTVAIGDNVNDVAMLDKADVAVSADSSKVKGDIILEEKDGVLPGERLLDLLL